MQIILSNMCLELVGTLNPALGYHIQKRKNGFFAKRNAKGSVPPDGHWRFIVLCAELAQNKLHIADVKVTNRELFEALREANLPSPAFLNWNNVEIFSASDIINFQRDYMPNRA